MSRFLCLLIVAGLVFALNGCDEKRQTPADLFAPSTKRDDVSFWPAIKNNHYYAVEGNTLHMYELSELGKSSERIKVKLDVGPKLVLVGSMPTDNRILAIDYGESTLFMFDFVSGKTVAKSSFEKFSDAHVVRTRSSPGAVAVLASDNNSEVILFDSNLKKTKTIVTDSKLSNMLFVENPKSEPSLFLADENGSSNYHNIETGKKTVSNIRFPGKLFLCTGVDAQGKAHGVVRGPEEDSYVKLDFRNDRIEYQTKVNYFAIDITRDSRGRVAILSSNQLVGQSRAMNIECRMANGKVCGSISTLLGTDLSRILWIGDKHIVGHNLGENVFVYELPFACQ